MALITGRRDDFGADPDPAALVVGDARADAHARVHVYTHMYRARLVEALESQFPRLARWLGADDFADLTAAHVADHPSRHPSLRFLGAQFPAWLARRPAAEARHPALADLARLEWARTDVFDAAAQAPLTIDAVRAWPAARFAELPLRLIGAQRRLTLAHPVAALWDAIGPSSAAPTAEPALADAATDAAGARDESLLVWRQGIAVFHRAIDGAERGALDAIAAGTTFGLVCEALARDRPAEEAATAATQAFVWLSTWSSDELLAVDAKT
jgi:Putative DNA-binding domain